jgi:hypothetical protein
MTKITVVIHQVYETSFSLGCVRVYQGHLTQESIEHQLGTRDADDGDKLTIEHHNLYSDVSETIKSFVFEREDGNWVAQ